MATHIQFGEKTVELTSVELEVLIEFLKFAPRRLEHGVCTIYLGDRKVRDYPKYYRGTN